MHQKAEVTRPPITVISKNRIVILKQNGHENTDLPREKQERKAEMPIEIKFEKFNFWLPLECRTLKAVNTKNAREI